MYIAWKRTWGCPFDWSAEHFIDRAYRLYIESESK